MAKRNPQAEKEADTRQALEATDDRGQRLELRDRIEAEVVRHEKHFDDFTGAVCTVEPVATPMDLHNLRLAATRLSDDPATTIDDLEAALKQLREFVFVYPQRAADAAS